MYTTYLTAATDPVICLIRLAISRSLLRNSCSRKIEERIDNAEQIDFELNKCHIKNKHTNTASKQPHPRQVQKWGKKKWQGCQCSPVFFFFLGVR